MSRHVDAFVHAKDATERSDAAYRSCNIPVNDLSRARTAITHLCDGIPVFDLGDMLAEPSSYSEDYAGCLEYH